MNPKLLLCLALVLCGGLLGSASAAEATNAATTTPNVADPRILKNTVKAVWTPITNTFFSANGSVVAMQNATRVVYEGRYDSGEIWKESLIAFVNPHNQKAYVFGDYTSFFAETDSGVMWVEILFSGLQWYPSLATGTNGIESAIAEYEQKRLNLSVRELSEKFDPKTQDTFIDFSVQFRLEGPPLGGPLLEKISEKDGILQLDLTPGKESDHHASAWVNIKTKKLIKVIEDGKQVFPRPPEFMAGSVARFVYVSIPCLLLIIYGSYRWWIHKSASRPKQAGNPNAP